MALKNGVDELARAKWRSSGLTDEHARKLRLTTLAAEECKRAGFLELRALRIPYFTPTGKPSAFYRVRYLDKPTGFKGTTVKPPRYAQPKGPLNEVYLPPLIDRPWADVLEDAGVQLFITEGELKAAKACAVGLACLGLGGVDVWRSTKRGLPMLPVLDDAEWKDRPVAIVYDSDAMTNDNVVRAQNQLARELTERGARPVIVSLPPGYDRQKQGLDDYLLTHTADDLNELVESAPELDEARSLWELNDEVAYIEDPGFILRRDNGQIIAPSAFVQHAFADRTYKEVVQTKTGPMQKKKPLAPRWVAWPGRFSLARLIYAPGQPPITEKREWNAWKGWGVQPAPGDVRPWHALLDYIFAGNAEARRWFERWCAYPLQHPGVKMFTSAVIWSVAQGTGKTLIGYTLRDIYGRNAVEIKGADLTGNFNDWARNRQFVIGDEVTGSDKRHDADRIKGLITQERVRVNEKYVQPYELNDCINYYFTSNHPDAFFLDDGDRRFFVHEVVGPPGPPELYKRYDAWLKKEDGPAHLFDYLLKLDLGDFNPMAPAPMTAAKEVMISMNKGELGTWVAMLKEDPERALLPLGNDVATKASLFTASQLFQAFDPMHSTRSTVVTMGRELARAGFMQLNGQRPVKTDGVANRLYAVRDQEKWLKASSKELGEEYGRWFGPNAKRKF